MAKSRYDRNVDKGAAQQRNTGQGMAEGCNKSGTKAEDPVETGQPGSGGSKHRGGPGKRNQESWRPKPTDDDKG